MKNRLYVFGLGLALIVVALTSFAMPTRAGQPLIMEDLTTVEVAIHVGATPIASPSVGASGGVNVGFHITPPHTTRYISTDQRFIDVSVAPGSSTNVTCAYRLTALGGAFPRDAAWTLKGGISNDLANSNSPFTRFIKYRIYDASTAAKGPFQRLIKLAQRLNQVIELPPKRGTQTMCVDLQISAPSSTAASTYYASITHSIWSSAVLASATPSPTPVSSPTPTPTPAYPEGTIAVFDSAVGSIFVFDGSQSGNVTPLATIIPPWGGTNPHSNGDHAHLTFDPHGNLWAAYSDADGYAAIAEYQPPLTNSSTPARLINGSATGLVSTWGMSYNDSHHCVVVSDNATKTISFFNETDNGDVTPFRTITGIDGASFLETDAQDVYEGIYKAGVGIEVFPFSASGATSPIETLFDSTWQNNTGITSLAFGSFDFDIYGDLFTQSTKDILYEFPANVTSTSQPTASASLTGYEIHTDANRNLYVLAYQDLSAYGPYSLGAIPSAPIREITSSAWVSPTAFAVYSPGRLNSAVPQ